MTERHTNHSDHRSVPEPSARCTAVRADGLPCRAWAVRGTDPPRCAPHGGGRAPVGAPRGNQNARTHGFYAHTGVFDDTAESGWTIEHVIADLSIKQASLSRYIDALCETGDLKPTQLARLLGLHGSNASRLGRLLRDKLILRGGTNERLEKAINEALDEISLELGVDL